MILQTIYMEYAPNGYPTKTLATIDNYLIPHNTLNESVFIGEKLYKIRTIGNDIEKNFYYKNYFL